MKTALMDNFSRRTRGFLAKNEQGVKDLQKKSCTFIEAFAMFQSYKPFAAKFDESIDLVIKLGTDPKRPDQNIKTSTVLPDGNGKKPKLLVFADGDQAKDSLKMGVSLAGVEEMIEAISSGKIKPGVDFDTCVATPEAMIKIAKSPVTKTLGQAGMLPNAKVGTVAKDVLSIVKDVLGGRVAIKADKSGFVRISVGRLSFTQEQLKANILSIYDAIRQAKPATFKGALFQSLNLSSTMSPFSVKIILSELYGAN